MSGLILCKETEVKNPYAVESLGISLYSAEELCYYIYNYTFLLEDHFISEPLLSFIGTELQMPKLEEKIRKWVQDQSDLTQILYMILQDIHYYSEAELGAFKQQLEWIRRAAPAEREKKKADFLLKMRRYEAAIRLYDEIAGGPVDPSMTTEFMGALYHNRGICFAGLFEEAKAMDQLTRAWHLTKNEVILKEMYLLELMSAGAAPMPEDLKKEIPAEQQFKWKEDHDVLAKHLKYSGSGKSIEALWEKDSLRKEAGVKELLTKWKQEYREMTKR